jgi:hypothetical protein
MGRRLEHAARDAPVGSCPLGVPGFIGRVNAGSDPESGGDSLDIRNCNRFVGQLNSLNSAGERDIHAIVHDTPAAGLLVQLEQGKRDRV